MSAADRIAAAAKRWAELVALIRPLEEQHWSAVAGAHLPYRYPEVGDPNRDGGGHRRFTRLSGEDIATHRLVHRWVYSEHMGELAGKDASRDPLLAEFCGAYRALTNARRAAGNARGALLRMTRNAIKRGEL